MRKSIIALLILLVIGIVAVITCPNRQAHKDALLSVVNDSIIDELEPSDTNGNGLSLIIGSIGSNVIELLFDNRLTIKNYIVFSTGVLKGLDGTSNTVSFGIFGHVFTPHKESLKKALRGE